MAGQPPICLHKADNFTVSDKWGQSLDSTGRPGFSFANAGPWPQGNRHSDKKLAGPSTAGHVCCSYMRTRATLTRLLREISPDPKNYQAFLLKHRQRGDGENCIKLAKTYALQKHGLPQEATSCRFVMRFTDGTMGAPLAGGQRASQAWMGRSRPHVCSSSLSGRL